MSEVLTINILMSENTLTQEETAMRFKKANAAGFINHMITAAGATQGEAIKLFQKSDQKANLLLNKRAAIRESILAEINGAAAPVATGDSQLPDNLSKAVS